MYTSFFGLHEKPFSITPDPRYLFMSERHAEALAHLLYGVRESGGFIQLTGEVGTGKTTLVRSLLQQLPDSVDVALILNPQLSRTEFLCAICEELHVPLPEARGSIKALIDALNQFLLENHSRGRRTILIVDEAQNLRPDVLEQVRLLTNLETTKQKLLQIILIGQPELRDLLSRNDMRQLAQRITGRYHLEPLSREEAEAYIDHRVRVAGGVGRIFADGSRHEIFRLGRGIPRMINVIADRALLGAFTAESSQVTADIVRRAAAEVYDRPLSAFSRWPSWTRIGVPVALAAALLAALSWWLLTPAGAPRATDEAITDGLQSSGGAIERAAALASLATLLDQAADAEGGHAAFSRLFALWGASYSAGAGYACGQAEAAGLRCLLQRGTLEDVKNLDTPVILTLRSRRGTERQVVLTGLQDDAAAVEIAGQAYRVAPGEIADFWQGEYLLLWRPQTAEVKSFVPGMRDPDILWLRASLATIQGEPIAPMQSDLYDQALEERVRQFQRERHLTADGLVSQQTQIAIIADLGLANTPKLARVN
ncbi:MAG: AAA family ATPase [Gammaproteobacteria bacterium]|nr:AAA family ATPase [Gammaproteobacteria bacterium]